MHPTAASVMARLSVICLPSRSKHHAVYVAGVNGALSKHPEFEKLDIVAVLKQATDMPADIKTAVRNHGAGRLTISTFCGAGPQWPP